MIEAYIEKFKKLRTDRNRKIWTERTSYRAPHKPFLLLSIMDLINQGDITANFIEPTFDLVEMFNTYWSAVMPPAASTSMAYPFYHMRSEGFWKLVPDIDTPVYSVSKLREHYQGAIIDETLFLLLQQSASQHQLRTALITTYFAPDLQPLVFEQGVVSYQAHAYGQELLRIAESAAGFEKTVPPALQEPKVRDQAFRKVIVSLYNHRCALCGIRMLTPEGHTVVEAAHIVPWHKSQDDRPSNGLSLCRLCHWSFDEGLMSVGKEYEVLVSKRVTLENNFPGHMLTLSDRRIFRPDDQKYWPDQENLNWHRQKFYERL
ncbi:MAG: HNH endonuclease [Thermodesulfobacteriota bacterium]